MTRPSHLVRVALLVLGAWTITSCSVGPVADDVADPAAVRSAAEDWSIEAPETVTAGDGFSVTVLDRARTAADGDSVGLDLVTPLGIHRFSATIRDHRAVIVIDGAFTAASGAVMAIASDTTGPIGSVSISVVPGDVVDGMVPLAGPRSIVADGEHWTMVTAFPTDRFGNSLPDGTVVTVHVRRPDGSVELIDGSVADLLASIRVPSGTLAGHTTIRLGVGDATGPEVDVLEVAGPPVRFALSVSSTDELRADGRTLVGVSTGSLEDRFGNVLPDGTAVTFRAEGPDGITTLVGTTSAGSADVHIEAPTTPGTVRLRAQVGAVQSELLDLEFVAQAATLPVSAQRQGDSVVLDVGPVLTPLGGFVPDGTQVAVTLDDQMIATAELRDGVARLTVVAAAGARLSIEVLATTYEQVAP